MTFRTVLIQELFDIAILAAFLIVGIGLGMIAMLAGGWFGGVLIRAGVPDSAAMWWFAVWFPVALAMVIGLAITHRLTENRWWWR